MKTRVLVSLLILARLIGGVSLVLAEPGVSPMDEMTVSHNARLIASQAFSDRSSVAVMLVPVRDGQLLEISYVWPDGELSVARSNTFEAGVGVEDFQAHIRSDHVQVFVTIPEVLSGQPVVWRFAWELPVRRSYLPVVEVGE